MFKPHRTYKHVNMLDTKMQVIKVQYRGPKYWKVRAIWYTESGQYLATINEQIPVKDFEKWSVCAGK